MSLLFLLKEIDKFDDQLQFSRDHNNNSDSCNAINTTVSYHLNTVRKRNVCIRQFIWKDERPSQSHKADQLCHRGWSFTVAHDGFMITVL